MFFKHAIPYRLPIWSVSQETLEKSLGRSAFQPCGQLEMERSGFVLAGETYARHVNDHILTVVRTEKKVIPASAVKRLVEEKAKAIEAAEGYRPGRKRLREIKEQVLDELLPKALAKHRDTMIWIAPSAGWIAVEASSFNTAELAIKLLSDALGDADFQIALFHPKQSLAGSMATWLTDDAPAGFTIDRECELQLPGEERSTVRYVRHALDGEEVAEHIAAGKMPMWVGMTWSDKISFVLTNDFAFKKIQFLDVLTEQAAQEAEDAESAFMAEVTLGAGELQKLFADMVEALGGEAEVE